MSKNKRFTWLALGLVLVLALAACGGQAAEVAPTAAAAVQEAAPVEEAATGRGSCPVEEAPAEEPWKTYGRSRLGIMPGGFMEHALNGEFAGTTGDL